jgi:hypothetical protein
MLRRVVSALSRSGEPSGKSGSSLVIRVSRAQSSIRVRRISSVSVSTRIVSSISFRPRQSRPSGGGLCDGGGGCIACDRNEEEECAALAPIKPRNGAFWPKEGRGWCGRDGGNGADTAVLAPKTRVSALQRDHVNESDFDRKRAEGENSVGASAILSVTYKNLRKTHAEDIAGKMRSKNAIKLRAVFTSNKISVLFG